MHERTFDRVPASCVWLAPLVACHLCMPQSATSSRLLVIDDNADVRKLVRMMLEDTDVEVVAEAANGAQGIELAGSCNPDIIVLDVSMPILDGFSALPEIRREAPRAWIVIWTASTVGDAGEAEALAAGADRYLRKAGNDPLAIRRFILESSAAGPKPLPPTE
ncbi:MAG: cheY [Thermoleophilia bacterium]|nr:cheY [Thermoleophilia bacterium]